MGANTIKGLTIAIGGDTTELGKALKDADSKAGGLAKELKQIETQLKFDPSSVDLLAQKQQVLKEEISATKEKLEALKKTQEELNKLPLEDQNPETMRALQREIIATEGKLKTYEGQLDETGDALVDATTFTEKATDATEDNKKAVDKSDKSYDGLKDTLKAVGTALGTVAASAATAAFALGKEVVKSFGELEQNLGGSEAVFGEYAASLQKTSESAYKSMGTSQSEYLATANKMGALFQGSGIEQQRSLELTTQAMQRATDMASVMGIDTASALEAVTGAAKGNYTMMDNLGVAMNATTLEAYAAAQSFETAFGQMTNAEKAEVAMQYFFENTSQYAGNFEREATETVSGSIGLLTASLSTFVAGLGNADADIGVLCQNVVEAFNAVVANITPVIENIVAALPTVVGAVISALTGMLPQLLSTAVELFGQVLSALVAVLPDLIPVVLGAVLLITSTLIDNLPAIIEAAIQIIVALVSGIGQALPTLIPAIIDCVFTIVDTLLKPSGIDMIVNAAITLMEGLTRGLIQAIPQIVTRIPEIIGAIVEAIARNLPELLRSGIQMIGELAAGLIQAIPTALKAIGDLLTRAKEKLIDKGQLKKWGSDMIQGIIDGIKSMISNVGQAAAQVAEKIKNFLHFSRPDEGPLRDYEKWMPDMVDGLVKGINKSKSKLDRAMYGLTAGASEALGLAPSARSGASVNSTSLGGVNITVYGAQGQDVRELADVVMNRLQTTYDGRRAAWA